ncbi:DUF3466 family protein [Vibrio ponticus]|uniref:DUF3466 family protein n=1 Tax=Vibrio ponticus TaxID=265668 RepID=A0A3N3DYX9_9VIBR|nr:DUF3466 family protein [Vibrio ponticus]ROV59408.1 DUF3466 family protein [Vibrio ponticus]
MRSNVFKLSAIAVTVCASFGAQAALYNVYHYAPQGENVVTHGVAISPADDACWLTDDNGGKNCADIQATFKIALETKKNAEGFNYRDESPFLLRDGFDYFDGDLFERFDAYCNAYLGYEDNSCDNWASQESNGYAIELSGDYMNSAGYVEDSQFRAGLGNVVINSFDADGNAIGNYQIDNEQRNVGFVENDDVAFGDGIRTRAWSSIVKDGKTLVVGSLSRQVNSVEYTSKATVWLDGSDPIEIAWESGSNVDGSLIPQGSARDVTVVDSKYYAVGYNTRNDGERLTASVFTSSDGQTWSTRFVALPNKDKSVYANSKLTSVNDKGVAIGEVKLNEIENGAYPNKLFYVENIPTTTGELTYKDFSSLSSSMFFTGANGKAGGINTHNEVVGQVDYQRKDEVRGTERAKRAFVTTIGSVSTSPLAGQTRYLDDLTMGSNTAADVNNNQYRIVDATDINDAGVISGTALYCSGGYATEDIGATCNAGSPTLVAVKLVPIQGATAADIQPRPVTETTIERQGASLGWLALGLLTLLGFRRKQ